MTRLARACRVLGIAHPNQFAWYCGLETYGLRDLMLRDLGYRGRARIMRRHDPRDSSVRPVYELRIGGALAFEARSLSEALEFLAEREAGLPQGPGVAGLSPGET